MSQILICEKCECDKIRQLDVCNHHQTISPFQSKHQTWLDRCQNGSISSLLKLILTWYQYQGTIDPATLNLFEAFRCITSAWFKQQNYLLAKRNTYGLSYWHLYVTEKIFCSRLTDDKPYILSQKGFKVTSLFQIWGDFEPPTSMHLIFTWKA